MNAKLLKLNLLALVLFSAGGAVSGSRLCGLEADATGWVFDGERGAPMKGNGDDKQLMPVHESCIFFQWGKAQASCINGFTPESSRGERYCIKNGVQLEARLVDRTIPRSNVKVRAGEKCPPGMIGQQEPGNLQVTCQAACPRGSEPLGADKCVKGCPAGQKPDGDKCVKSCEQRKGSLLIEAPDFCAYAAGAVLKKKSDSCPSLRGYTTMPPPRANFDKCVYMKG